GIVGKLDHQLLAENAAILVDLLHSSLGAVLDLLAIGGDRARHRGHDTDDDVGLRAGCESQRGEQCDASQKLLFHDNAPCYPKPDWAKPDPAARFHEVLNFRHNGCAATWQSPTGERPPDWLPIAWARQA